MGAAGTKGARLAVCMTLILALALAAHGAGELLFDVQPVTLEGRTMVPLRPIFEWLGARVEYDDTGRIAAYRSETAAAPSVELWVGSSQAKVGESPYQLDVPPQLIHDRCFVPLRFVAESFGVWVEAEGRRMKLSLPQEAIEAVMAVPPHPQAHLGKIWRVIERWYDVLPPDAIGTPEQLPHWRLYSQERQAAIIAETGSDAPTIVEAHWGGRAVRGIRVLDGQVEPGAERGWAEVKVGYGDGTLEVQHFDFVREPTGWKVNAVRTVDAPSRPAPDAQAEDSQGG